MPDLPVFPRGSIVRIPVAQPPLATPPRAAPVAPAANPPRAPQATPVRAPQAAQPARATPTTPAPATPAPNVRVTRSGAGPSRHRGMETVAGRARTDPAETIARKRATRGRRVVIRGPIKLATVVAKLQALAGTTDESGRPVNTASTYKTKVSSIRSLIRKHLQSQGIAKPSEAQIANTNLRDIIRPPAAELVRKLSEFWPNASTRTTVMGYIVSVIDLIQHENFAFTDSEYARFYEAMLAGAARRNEQRARNEVPQIIAENQEITWAKFVEAEKELRENEFASAKHLTLACRVLFGPRRDSDWTHMKFVNKLPTLTEEHNKWNYCEIPNDGGPVKLSFRNYKTQRTYGIQTFHLTATSEYSQVSAELAILGDILRESRRARPRTWVFPAAHSDSFSATRNPIELKSIVDEITGVAFGVQILRRIYVTAMLAANPSALKRKLMAFMLAHSVEQGTEYAYARDNEAPNDADLAGLNDRLALLEEAQLRMRAEIAKYRSAIATAANVLNNAMDAV